MESNEPKQWSGCARCDRLHEKLHKIAAKVAELAKHDSRWHVCHESQLLNAYAIAITDNYIDIENFEHFEAIWRDISQNINTAMMQWLDALPKSPLGTRIYKPPTKP